MAQVYVGNLTARVSEKNIDDEFRPYSAAQYVRITRKSPNYAFVDFDDRNDALRAIRNLDGINGWYVKLSHHFKGGGGGGRRGRGAAEELKCCYECGQHGHFAKDCRFFRRGADQRVEYAWRIERENIASCGNKDQSKVEVNEVPREKVNVVSENSDQSNVRSKPVRILEEESSSIGALAQNLKAKLEEKERELGAIVKENDSLRSMLNEADSKIREAKAQEEEMALKFKIQREELEKSKNQVTFARTKAEDVSLMLRKLRAELEKSKCDAYSAKAREVEMNLKLKTVRAELEKVKNDASLLKKLEEELQKSEKKVVQLQENLKEVKGEKETLETEMKNIRGKTDEWRKAAAASAIFAVGVEINTEISESEPLILCYNNRAKSRMSLGRVREALWYCIMAATLDPSFLEVHLAAANCHLMLGEIKDALYYYNKCLDSGTAFSFDRKTTIEASDGVQKAQKVVSCTKQSSELLQQRSFDSATNALKVIGEALSISCYSEKLLEMKGDTLFVLRKYEDVVQLCETTLEFAEKNFTTLGVTNQVENVEGKNLTKLWRWNLMSKSYFCLGRLEIALNFIEKQEQLRSKENKNEESTSHLAATIRGLLRFKNMGNEAFQSGRYSEAIKNYTNAISKSIESCPFSAVCFSNRAAAYQALGEIIDAIADCSLALALDGSYLKALSRRATLHEMIRDYEQAICDLKRLISLYEKQSAGRQHGSNKEDLKQARHRLFYIEEKAKRGTTMDLYLILGLEASDSASEVKKAYRKAALRHHPDKAGLFLARTDNGYDGQLFNQIRDLIFKDADRLFKIVGKAYSVLSESSMRSKFDREEEMRYESDEDDDRSDASSY